MNRPFRAIRARLRAMLRRRDIEPGRERALRRSLRDFERLLANAGEPEEVQAALQRFLQLMRGDGN